jgi:hypothetical protein
MHDVHESTWHRLFRPTSARGVDPALGTRWEVVVLTADIRVGRRLIGPRLWNVDRGECINY